MCCLKTSKRLPKIAVGRGGKVTLKSNGDEELSDEFLNKITAMKR
jgi:hypothetical protein